MSEGNAQSSQELRIICVHPGAELYGADRMFLSSVLALHEADMRVTVVTPARGELTELLEAQGLRVATINFPVLRKSALKPLGLVALLLQSFRSSGPILQVLRREQPQVIYVSTVTAPIWLVWGALLGVPLVCHVHEAETLAARVLQFAITSPLHLCRVVIVNSLSTKDNVLRHSVGLGRRIQVVYNCVAAEFMHRMNLYPATTGCLQLVVVGRLSARKGQDVAIRALACLRDRGVAAHLRLVGSVYAGNEAFELELHGLCRALGVEDLVEFAGFQVNPVGAYDRAHVVLVPSRTEPFGNVAIEAMARGRPVVVSAVDGLKETARHEVEGIHVRVEDPIALAAAIESLLDAEKASLMGVAGRRRVSEQFTAAAYAGGVVAAVRAAAYRHHN